MKIYVAGRVKQMRRVRAVQQTFKRYGHVVTFDWTGPEGEQKPDWSHDPEWACTLSKRERRGVLDADGVVLVGHGCEEGGGGLGCFVEVGMAMAYGRPVVVYGPCRESVFWYLPRVTRVRYVNQCVPAMYDLLREGL